MPASSIQPVTTDVIGAAEYLNLSKSTVRRMIDAGELPVVRFGRRVVIRLADLDALLASR